MPPLNGDTPRPWWDRYFSANYGRLYKGPLGQELDTDADIATLRGILTASGPILDIGCGHGRHLVPLREAGSAALGIDYSAQLLAMIPAEHRRSCARADMRHLPFRDHTLAGAYILFNTLGYFDDDDNLLTLTEIARVLRPGAPLILDAPARSGMRATVKDVPSIIRVHEHCEVHESWTFDDETGRLNASGTWNIDGDTQEWTLSLRVYTPTEITRLLRKAGFTGAVEIRPIEDIALLGTGEPTLPLNASAWRNAPNMTALARR